MNLLKLWVKFIPYLNHTINKHDIFFFKLILKTFIFFIKKQWFFLMTQTIDFIFYTSHYFIETNIKKKKKSVLLIEHKIVNYVWKTRRKIILWDVGSLF